MTYRGLDYGPGLTRMGDLLAQGYKDRLALQNERASEANKLTQQDFENTQAAAKTAYEYPSELALPVNIASSIQDPRVGATELGTAFSNPFKSGYETRNDLPNQRVIVVPAGSRGPAIDQGMPQGNRGPASARPNPNRINPGDVVQVPQGLSPQRQGDPNEPYVPPTAQPETAAAMPVPGGSAATVGQPETTEGWLAKELGLKVQGNHLVGHPKQIELYAKLYDKLLGSAASTVVAGAKQAQPVVVHQTPAAGKGAAKTPQILPYLKASAENIKSQMAAEAKMISRFGMDPQDNAHRANVARLGQQLADINTKIDTAMTQAMTPQSTGKAVPMPHTSAGAPAATLTVKYSKSANKTYFIDGSGSIVKTEDGDTRATR